MVRDCKPELFGICNSEPNTHRICNPVSITILTFISLYRQRNESKKAIRNDASARSEKLLEIIQK